MRDGCMASRPPDPSVITSEPNTVTFYSLHIRVMYWAFATMSSMGYGRAPTAFTELEYTYAICAQIAGACLAAAIFSNIGQMLNKGDQVTIRYQAQLDKVREFSKLYKLSKTLRRKLADYNELLFAVSRGYDTAAIATMFPAPVQEEIFIDMHLEAIGRVPMFQVCQAAATRHAAPPVGICDDPSRFDPSWCDPSCCDLSCRDPSCHVASALRT